MISEPDEFEQGYYGIHYGPEDLASMSTAKLAIALSKTEKSSPGYTVLEQELAMRPAKEQAKATRYAAWIAAIGTIVATLIVIAAASWTRKEPSSDSNSEVGAGANSQSELRPIAQPKPLTPPAVDPGAKDQTIGKGRPERHGWCCSR